MLSSLRLYELFAQSYGQVSYERLGSLRLPVSADDDVREVVLRRGLRSVHQPGSDEHLRREFLGEARPPVARGPAVGHAARQGGHNVGHFEIAVRVDTPARAVWRRRQHDDLPAVVVARVQQIVSFVISAVYEAPSGLYFRKNVVFGFHVICTCDLINDVIGT